MSLNCSFSVMHWDIIMCLVSNERRENALDNEAYSLIKICVAIQISHWQTGFPLFWDTRYIRIQCCKVQWIMNTVYAIYFAGVLFSRISRVGAFREFNDTRPKLFYDNCSTSGRSRRWRHTRRHVLEVLIREKS